MKNNILILLLLFIASFSYGQRAITQQIVGVDEFVPYVGAAQDVDLGNFDLSGDTLKMNGVSLYSIISDSTQTAIIDSLTYSNDTLTVIEGGVNHKVEIISGGSTDYISNVTEASNNITFTGVGSAFNGSIGSIAKTDVANAFSLSAAGFAMDLFNSNGSGSGFRVRGNNIALSVNNGSATERFRVEGDGDVFALNLSAGTKTNVVYIDPSTKELFEGAAPSGTSLWQDLGTAIAPLTISDEVRIGSTSDLGAAKLQITGQVLATDNIESQQIIKGGSFTLESATPNFSIIDTDADDFTINANSSVFQIRNDTDAKTLLEFNSDYSLEMPEYGSGTYTGTAAYNLEVDANGNVIETTAGSDFRLKENFRTLNNSLDKILNINTYAFDWRNNVPNKAENESFDIKVTNDFKERESAGVIAQEIIDIIPESVKQYNNGYYKVDYEVIVPHLIEAIKEQQKQINELKSLINK